jgi:hypothetical protein
LLNTGIVLCCGQIDAMSVRSLVTLVAVLVTGAGAAAYAEPYPGGPDSRAPAGSGIQQAQAPLAGTSCRAFPANNYWHADVRRLPRHPRSIAWLSHMSPRRRLHPDFGPSYGDGPDYGMPVTVVSGAHRRVGVGFTYAGESDRVRYPFGRDTRIEGGRGSDGDRHAVVVDRSRCRLYETWATRVRAGRWRSTTRSGSPPT